MASVHIRTDGERVLRRHRVRIGDAKGVRGIERAVHVYVQILRPIGRERQTVGTVLGVRDHVLFIGEIVPKRDVSERLSGRNDDAAIHRVRIPDPEDGILNKNIARGDICHVSENVKVPGDANVAREKIFDTIEAGSSRNQPIAHDVRRCEDVSVHVERVIGARLSDLHTDTFIRDECHVRVFKLNRVARFVTQVGYVIEAYAGHAARVSARDSREHGVMDGRLRGNERFQNTHPLAVLRQIRSSESHVRFKGLYSTRITRRVRLERRRALRVCHQIGL